MDAIALAMILVMEFEGFEPHIYDDFGHPAIGYGHRITPGDEKIYRDGVDRAVAGTMLRSDLRAFHGYVNSMVHVKLNKYQRASLISLMYNVGPEAFGNSKALQALNQGNEYLFLKEAFDQDVGFVRTGGKVLKGLVRRRAAERKLFVTPAPDAYNYHKSK